MQEIIVKNHNGKETAILRENALIISRGGKDRMIPLSQIVSFDVVDPKGKWSPGTITIRISGQRSLEEIAGSLFNIGGGITFNHSIQYLEAARQMQQAIADYSAKPEPEAAENRKVVSVVEEIRGLKGLLDDGIITQEEFEAKKKQLLNI